MDNDRQQAIAAVDFTGRWAVRGYEKGKNLEFWLELLVDVLRVTIEQKSLGKDLRKPLLQCDGAMMGLLSVGSGEGLMAWGGSLKTGAKLAVQSVRRHAQRAGRRQLCQRRHHSSILVLVQRCDA